MYTPLSSARGPGPGRASQSQSPFQVTASVVRFRCLYTHDLRRKSKRWQDGYLKYHAFNKRIMVYDEPGNYIGDHHWRSAEEVQDGDELELDKGALIQVGERLSTTQTDISNLFEKKASCQGSPQSNDPASQASRISTPIRSSGSSQPFRSLNDLLGIKKTPIGHLGLPYEARHPPPPSSDDSLPSQRAPKRRKVAPMERPVVNNRNTPAEMVDLTDPEETLRATELRNVVTTRETPRRQPPEPIPRPLAEKPREAPKAANPQSLEPPKPSIPPEKPRDGSKATAPQRPEPPQFTKPSMPPDKSRGVLKATKPSFPPEKLGDAPTATKAPRPEPPAFVKPPLPFPSASSSHPPKVTMRSATDNVQPEPLGLRRLPDENLPRPLRPTPNTSSSEAPRIIAQRDIAEVVSDAVETTSFKKEPTYNKNPGFAVTANTPAHELDSTTNAEFLPSDSTQFILDEMAGGSNRGITMTQSPNLPARRALDAPLRKSLSDPTALTAQRTLQSRSTLMQNAMSSVSEQPEVYEEGPWTCEALDLFDFWPPGRPKPS
ncbi:hypothetical protein PENDEC_c011G06616 [Penicillium decumbens]|uniref:5'-3' DNA helicase ZGRF1-like N-terminal domain-containing protein n=1 Tax=Penicillium decumbens TaxID=69771 RepID=A0A1V6PCR5_PENDC|nr:hypothetical protein PENDEC_c011G06616 [Penicillium decumbens]